MLLNVLGGIGSGIWLAILGEWGAIGAGVGAMIVGMLIVAIALMPGLAVSMAGIALYDKGAIGKILGLPLMVLSLLWTYVVMCGWALLAFWYFLSSASYEAFWPLLIWSYGVASAPWTYMAQKEQSEHAAATAFFLQIGCASLLVTIGLLGSPIDLAVSVFFLIMLVSFLLNVGSFITNLLEEAKFNQMMKQEELSPESWSDDIDEQP